VSASSSACSETADHVGDEPVSCERGGALQALGSPRMKALPAESIQWFEFAG
jgi:hypothetical protein